MNAKDTKRLQAVIDQANKLMNVTPQLNPVVRDVDVIECTLADLQRVLMGKDPVELAKLIELDEN